jgi:endonuclease/exonuclease/phosphatase family metal-dependent hydrolase
MIYLNPDIITFNEIPNAKTYEMTNFVNVFLPGYFMATNSGTDGSIRSVIVSRYPIARSQKWLDGIGLTNFGYAGTFTRDLFEAEITVPGASEPLHVFTTHLKSGPDGDSQDRRAAEASAISNFLVSVFIPGQGHRPYVLTGDLNEDIDLPLSHDHQPIQRLTSVPTGLHLTTPLNPFTFSPFTHSIQIPDGLDARFDYILPAGVLFSNRVGSEVFRTDVLESPPPPLLADDSVTASDHLPVVMVFNYPDPPLVAKVTTPNGTLLLHWPALVGRKYAVEGSANLENWSVVASNIIALSGQQSWTAPVGAATQFYRVARLP